MNCGTTIDDLMKLVAKAEEHTRDTRCELAAPVPVEFAPVFDLMAEHAASPLFFVPQAHDTAMIGVA